MDQGCIHYPPYNQGSGKPKNKNENRTPLYWKFRVEYGSEDIEGCTDDANKKRKWQHFSCLINVFEVIKFECTGKQP